MDLVVKTRYRGGPVGDDDHIRAKELTEHVPCANSFPFVLISCASHTGKRYGRNSFGQAFTLQLKLPFADLHFMPCKRGSPAVRETAEESQIFVKLMLVSQGNKCKCES